MATSEDPPHQSDSDPARGQAPLQDLVRQAKEYEDNVQKTIATLMNLGPVGQDYLFELAFFPKREAQQQPLSAPAPRDSADADSDPRDEAIMEKWRAGRSAAAIARDLELEEQTIFNRVSALRQKYGAERVPIRRPKTGK